MGLLSIISTRQINYNIYLINNSEENLHQFVCVSIYHIRFTGVQHILCIDTDVPWLAQTTDFCASFFCIILQYSLVCFNLPKALVPSEGHCAVVTASRKAKWLVGKDARNVVVLCVRILSMASLLHRQRHCRYRRRQKPQIIFK
jgi:hypothetical protein